MTIGVGTDIVRVERIRESVERHGDRFLRRIFTAGEIKYCSERRRKFEHLAGHFAVKEAVLKALGTGASKGATLRQVEVTHDAAGSPTALLHRGALRVAEERGISHVHVSLSHEETFAVALAVAEG